MARSWSEAELAYFAGIIDGEGCFAVHKQSESVFGLQLQVGNTDPQMMHWIHQRFGGSMTLEHRRNPKHQPIWRWAASAKDLDRLVPSLVPYLITKKRQAELFIAYRQTLNSVGAGKRARGISHSTTPKTADIVQRRAQIYAELSALKRPMAATA